MRFEGGYRRLHHLDLRDTALVEIQAERRRLRFFLDYERRPDRWHLERLAALTAEFEARRRAGAA
jgi:hypothetical protein